MQTTTCAPAIYQLGLREMKTYLLTVLFIVGINKISPDLDSAMKRARNVAAPANIQRFASLNPPCKKAGRCFDCKSPDTICCQFLITRYSMHKDRIHVILVNDALGF